jgi:hypothetical protein
MKLTKIQREILETALASELEHGVAKPITVFQTMKGRDLRGYNARFASYVKQMWTLIDAGIIEPMPNSLAYCRIVGVNKVRDVLAAQEV